DRARAAGADLTWVDHHVEDWFVDFNALLQQRTEYNVAYAVCYVVSPEEKTGLRLKAGSDDQAKVYLNGQEVYRYAGKDRPCVRDRDTVEGLTLRKGTNVVVFKVVNERIDWKACLRFVDGDGRPAAGLTVARAP